MKNTHRREFQRRNNKTTLEKIGVKKIFLFRKLISKTVHMNYLFK